MNMIKIDILPEDYAVTVNGREFFREPKSIFLEDGEKIYCSVGFLDSPFVLNGVIANISGHISADNSRFRFIDFGDRYLMRPQKIEYIPYTLPSPVVQHRAVFGASQYLITIYKNGGYGLIAEGQNGYLSAEIPVKAENADFMPLNISGKNLLLVKCSGNENFYMILNLSAPPSVEFSGIYDSAEIGLLSVIFTKTEKDFMRHKLKTKFSYENGKKQISVLPCEEFKSREYNPLLKSVLFLEAVKASSVSEAESMMAPSLKNDVNFDDVKNYIGGFDEIFPLTPEINYVISGDGSVVSARKVEILTENGLITDLNVI